MTVVGVEPDGAGHLRGAERAGECPPRRPAVRTPGAPGHVQRAQHPRFEQHGGEHQRLGPDEEPAGWPDTGHQRGHQRQFTRQHDRHDDPGRPYAPVTGRSSAGPLRERRQEQALDLRLGRVYSASGASLSPVTTTPGSGIVASTSSGTAAASHPGEQNGVADSVGPVAVGASLRFREEPHVVVVPDRPGGEPHEYGDLSDAHGAGRDLAVAAGSSGDRAAHGARSPPLSPETAPPP
ncbi:hypothetical protein WQ59_21700 [Streptomyces sp. KE1]|nr:hypothetical protein WQ59_21700 [Streptomyces sp. KE1]